MEIDFKVEVDHRWIYERPYKVTLTRGAKGDYRWEIEVRSGSYQEMLADVEKIKEQLCSMYNVLEPTGEEG